MEKKQSIEHAQLLILSLLAAEDLYGYQMIVKEGTLYPLLHGLEQRGLVESYQQTAPSGRLRKYYHLTKKGAAACREEREAWRRYAAGVNAVVEFGASMA